MVSGLRRLFGTRQRATRDARTGSSEGELRVRLGYRLLEPLPLLHEYLWVSHHSRPSARFRDGNQGQPARPLRVGGDRRWGRTFDRRQPSAAYHPAEHRHPDPAVQQPGLRSHEGAILADFTDRDANPVDTRRFNRPSHRSARIRVGSRWLGRSTSTVRISSGFCEERTATREPP